MRDEQALIVFLKQFFHCGMKLIDIRFRTVKLVDFFFFALDGLLINGPIVIVLLNPVANIIKGHTIDEFDFY